LEWPEPTLPYIGTAFDSVSDRVDRDKARLVSPDFRLRIRQGA
jgi:hypothetical protein